MASNAVRHFKDWAIDQHVKTNHLYDENLPYSFHLKLVVKRATKFKGVWKDLYGDQLFAIMYNACWGHDLIEDTRTSFNDILKFLIRDSASDYDKISALHIANIIFALTNNKGRNRAERANADYYNLIKQTPGAIFVKLCDRMANIEYGKLMGSSMYDKYKEEHMDFLINLGLITRTGSLTEEGQKYESMIVHLSNVLEIG